MTEISVRRALPNTRRTGWSGPGGVSANSRTATCMPGRKAQSVIPCRETGAFALFERLREISSSSEAARRSRCSSARSIGQSSANRPCSSERSSATTCALPSDGRSRSQTAAPATGFPSASTTVPRSGVEREVVNATKAAAIDRIIDRLARTMNYRLGARDPAPNARSRFDTIAARKHKAFSCSLDCLGPRRQIVVE